MKITIEFDGPASDGDPLVKYRMVIPDGHDTVEWVDYMTPEAIANPEERWPHLGAIRKTILEIVLDRVSDILSAPLEGADIIVCGDDRPS